jgi:hypothetical protein
MTFLFKTVSAEWATAYELMKLGGSDFHGRGTLDEIDIGEGVHLMKLT